MKNAYQIVVFLLSIIIWIYFVGWYIFLFIVLAEIAYAIPHYAKSYKTHKYLLISFITLSVFLLVGLKELNVAGVYLPIGYSVFMFSAISLLVDCRKRSTIYNRLEVYNYLFFFPKAFAGPIERVDKLIPQLNNPKLPDKCNIYIACKILIFAVFCKYVVADNLYEVDFDTVQGIDLLFSIISYALAFYLDFYAYSLFAIALGKLFGIELSMNFLAPYSSNSFKEFWSKWNITLSLWLRDYIYIPLGGSQQNQIRTILNIFIVFLISAAWHNITLPFIIWGVFHASFVVLEKYTKLKTIYGYKFIVFIVTCCLWQLFRIDNLSEVNTMIGRMLLFNGVSLRLILTTFVGLATFHIIEKNSFKQLIFSNDNYPLFIYKEVGVLAIMLVLFILLPHNLSINFFYLRF